MTRIELRFPARRYHANPWGRHVNEGVAEWPPSPYRLLRALYDVWKRKCADIPAERIAGLFSALAREAPEFDLPRALPSHTRSYLSSNTEDVTDKSLIFDGFISVPPEAVCSVTWQAVDLTPEQQETLRTLLPGLNYLGRSESWIEASLVQNERELGSLRCAPLERSKESGTVVLVACPMPESEYREERPWLEALTFSTTDLVKGKEHQSDPPLLRRVRYVLPTDDAHRVTAQESSHQKVGVDTLMLRLDGAVLPLATATIEVAEQIRSKLMGAHARIVGDRSRVSPLFSGKDSDGTPDRCHAHLFILPVSNDRGRIDRILLVSPKRSFNLQERRAALRVRSLWQRHGRPDVKCILVDEGRAARLRPGAKVVVSTTPFVSPRHTRRGRGIDWLIEEVRRECRHHGQPLPLAVEPLNKAPGLFEWIEYRRNRKDDLPRPGYGFRLRFAEPVPVPFSLGYGAHFGLGQFASAENS